MFAVQSPPEIGLISPSSFDIVTWTRRAPMRTFLFRKTALLPEALSRVYAHHPDTSSLDIISAGCSSGAEVDGLIGLHSRSGHPAQLAVTGYDNNPSALVAAGRAGHQAPVDGLPGYLIEHIGARLTEYGFEVEHEQADDGLDGLTLSCLYAGSQALRAGHDVSFELADITQHSLPKRAAQLVVATHVLHHLVPDQAEVGLRTLADALHEEKAVLSVGEASVAHLLNEGDGIMGSWANLSDVRYGDWWAEMRPMLAREYELTPVQPADSRLQPHLFERR